MEEMQEEKVAIVRVVPTGVPTKNRHGFEQLVDVILVDGRSIRWVVRSDRKKDLEKDAQFYVGREAVLQAGRMTGFAMNISSLFRR
ncbi:MAG: hypothetical protein ACYCYO_20725 [Bacilli bacterium]